MQCCQNAMDLFEAEPQGHASFSMRLLNKEGVIWEG